MAKRRGARRGGGFNAPSVQNNRFALVPRADIPRSKIAMQMGHKTTFDAGRLIPVFCREVLPGDHHQLRMTAFARMTTPIFPVMDNLYLDSFFFFVPCRLVWENWEKFMGEKTNPSDTTTYLIPQVVSPASGFTVNGIYDYFGLPTNGQVGGGNTVSVNALPLRCYNLIYNEWFRDQNLINSATINMGDGPDASGDFSIRRRGKRHDYFTSCLPWPQKGDSVSIPLVGTAPVSGIGIFDESTADTGVAVQDAYQGASAVYGFARVAGGVGASRIAVQVPDGADDAIPSIYADLDGTTVITINELREAFQIQRLLERDARGGTRYTESIRAQFGVISPDARLQRPEYLGGGSTPIQVNPVAQQSATGLTGGSSALGTLSGVATAVANGHGFSYAATEHGYIIGLVNVRADLTYQQGLSRMWTRQTRYDFYTPVFAHLGEQAVLRKEIYCVGNSGQDDTVFGYQERWAEYHYMPSMITGLFRSTSSGTIDPWHLAQRFTTAPVLGQTFIEDSPPIDRVVAVGSGANGKQFLFDSVFDLRSTMAMPVYSVPGLIDHF